MNTVELTAPTKSHLLTVVRGLVRCGWTIKAAPANGRLARNGQLISLETPKRTVRIRLFVYKVTGSSRELPDERRVEITSTYQKGLQRRRGFQDVVLGLDPTKNIFVGIDPRRIEHGGPTGNASSFFDRKGLEWKRSDELFVAPRQAKLFDNGIEYHAFFKESCLPQYLLNVSRLHSGMTIDVAPTTRRSVGRRAPKLRVPTSSTDGEILILQGRDLSAKPREALSQWVTAFEETGQPRKRGKRKLSPSELMAIKRRCEENGYIGEELVLGRERARLKRADRPDLALQVSWLSLESVSEGYDILSFEVDGTKRYIEVKSAQGNAKSFEMSKNEWERAEELGARYFIYRVTYVRTDPKIRIIENPWAGLSDGRLERATVGWLVTILKGH
jgi:hypothetical protein